MSRLQKANAPYWPRNSVTRNPRWRALCTAPGFLDNRYRYAARLAVSLFHAARISSGLRWPFFSISQAAL